MNAARSLARNGRSFHFATRVLPADQRERVANAYAFCRATDDLVDETRGASPAQLHRLLDEWLDGAAAAYDGSSSGVALVDRVMRDMRSADVPFVYVEELVRGMRMDIGVVRYRDLGELRVYTHRVAGVVGIWMSTLFGAREPWVLGRAAALGHAMQLTNIVRDVGSDWDIGRLYLPSTLLNSYGVTEQDIAEMRAGRPITPAFRACMEAMMTLADASYRHAFDAIRELPPAFGRSVAIAAEVYRGIHDEVRRTGYDTITRRAFTSFGRKLVLGARGLQRASLSGQPAGVSDFQKRTLVAS